MDNIQDNIKNLKIAVSQLENNYSVLYKKSPFLNDNIKLDNDTKKVFGIHFLNENKYSIGDIYELYLKYLNDKKLIDEDFVNLNIEIKENLNIEKNTIFIKDLFKFIKLKFIK